MILTQFGKIIVATDFHYGLSRNSKSKLSILKDYVEPKIIKELSDGDEPKTLVICGDLFHEMVSVRTDIYKEAKSFLMKCSSLPTVDKVILIAGNHDCFDDTTDVTSIELFEQLDRINVVRYASEKEIYGLKCLFLPWSDNNETSYRFKHEIYDCVFCHPDVPREFFGGMYLSEHGNRTVSTKSNLKFLETDELLNEKSETEAIPLAERKKVSAVDSMKNVINLAKVGGTVFAGHIHKHSESIVNGRSLFFVGSPYQTTSEEIGSKSGYYVISTSGTKFREIKAPEHVKIRFSDIKRVGIDGYDFSKVHNNIVRFDGDDIISVELETMIKRKVMEYKPFEVAETDYSNLVTKHNSPETVGKIKAALSETPKSCVCAYVENLPSKVFDEEKVSKAKVLDTFGALYDLIEKKTGIMTIDGGATIRYKKMVATNFLSYDKLEFDFEKYKGITLIYGRNLDNIGATNACGKSNIIKAIVYSLFGRFPKKVKKENMAPWESGPTDVNVTITLESNGVNYQIDSGMLRGKDSYHRVFNLDTGEELTRKQIAETRKFIEDEILHCDFEMFTKTTILTSSEIFNFYVMKKEDKDDYLNTIFGTKVLHAVREEIKKHLKSERSTYLEESRVLESKVHDIELNRNASVAFETNRKNSLESNENEIKRLEVEIDELKESESPENKKIIADLTAKRNETESEISQINSKIRKLRDENSSLLRNISKNKTTVEVMSGELLKHKDVLPKLCTDCKKIAAKGYGLTEYSNMIKKSREAMVADESRYASQLKEIDELESKRDVLTMDIMRIDGEIRSSRTNSDEIYRRNASIQAIRSTIEYIKRQENPNNRIIERLEADRSELEKKVEEVSTKIRHLDFIQSRVVSQDVITNLITSGFISQLNERIRYYLQRLGLNLGVEFDNDFQYEFVRGNGAKPEFNSLSGGESLRIVIATSFAFKDFLESRRNISSNIRFLDEFFEKDADNLGMNKTIEILKDFTRLINQNVFLISNKLNEIDDSVFDNTLVVTIQNSKSSVSEEIVGSM